MHGGWCLTSTSHVKIDHLLAFETDEQKQEFERICKTSSSVQRYKKKLVLKNSAFLQELSIDLHPPFLKIYYGELGYRITFFLFFLQKLIK